MFRNKWTILIVILLFAAIGLSACAQPTPEVVEKVVEVTVVTEKEVEKVVEQTVVVEVEKEVEKVVEVTPTPEPATMVTLNLNLGTEPPTLDPSLATDTTSIEVIGNQMVGLTVIDPDTNEVVPGLAESWDISEDGMEYTFHLRQDNNWVKYNPGTGEVEVQRPVTAQDVVYGVKRTLDPRTASDYAYVLYIIKGGEELNNADIGAMSDEEAQALLDAVGVEALDEYTVKFTLADPAPYFPSIASMWVAMPMPQEVIEAKGERWQEPGFIWTNGAMVLTKWAHDDSLQQIKNPYWWGADDVQIDVIDYVMVTEASTAYAMYLAGDLDAVGAPQDEIDSIKADPVLSQELMIAPSPCTYYYGFVNTKAPLDNADVRRALSAAIDRKGLIDNVTKGNQLPANTFAPAMIFGSAAGDPDIAPWALPEDMGGTGYDKAVELAKGWLQDAGYADGSELGTITLMHNTSEGHARIAQAIAAMWKDVLNIDVAVENQEWKVYLNSIKKDVPLEEVPHVFRLGWCADYADQNNWLNEVFNPEMGADRLRLQDAQEYIDLMDKARASTDPEERKALYKEGEKWLSDTHAAYAPIYYYTTVSMTKPWVIYRTAGTVGPPLDYTWKLDWDAKKAALGLQ
ncbi:MAG TPA: peptide ABC transporter substrate-binding protein [Caldilineae bacterium]|nr:peptide ABC transporter substrate-binding protein [Caldilineae bacterium]